MRDLLNLLDNLAESRGLSARNPGEIYSRGANADDQITFQGLTFYPEVGSYANSQEMIDAFNELQDRIGREIEQVNRPNARTRAFGIAEFDTAVGRRYLVKFAEEIKPVRTQNTFFQTKRRMHSMSNLCSTIINVVLSAFKRKPRLEQMVL